MDTEAAVEKELVTARTLGEMLDVKIATIRDWKLKGKIPYVKLPTGGVRFHVQTIRKWYRSGNVEVHA